MCSSKAVSQIMSFHSFVLKPIGAGASYLKDIRVDDGQKVMLGRNKDTFLNEGSEQKCLYVSRKHAELEKIGDELFVTMYHKDPRVVHVNGKAAFSNEKRRGRMLWGDKLSLLGESQWFNFMVTMEEEQASKKQRLDSGGATSVAALSLSSSSSSSSAAEVVIEAAVTVPAPARPAIQPPKKSDMERSLECAICFELIACGHCISSCDCGNTYCYSCIVDIPQHRCPTCDEAFAFPQLMHNRSVDAMVRLLLKDSADALKEWEGRHDQQLCRKKGLGGKLAAQAVTVPVVTVPVVAAPVVVAPVVVAPVVDAPVLAAPVVVAPVVVAPVLAAPVAPSSVNSMTKPAPSSGSLAPSTTQAHSLARSASSSEFIDLTDDSQPAVLVAGLHAHGGLSTAVTLATFAMKCTYCNSKIKTKEMMVHNLSVKLHSGCVQAYNAALVDKQMRINGTKVQICGDVQGMDRAQLEKFLPKWT